MALSIPNRQKSGKKSFPTSPDAVSEWLGTIQPIHEIESIKELYRGLKHTNRLESSTRNRLETAEILEPAVLEALEHLEDRFFGQSLPLLPKAEHARILHESLMLELAHSWKLVVNETYATLLPGQVNSRTIGIYKALRILAKLIETRLVIRKPLPARLMEDLNTLYHFAIKSNLCDKTLSDANPEFNPEWTLENAYIHALVLSMVDPYYHRLGHIRLLSEFLSGKITTVTRVIPPDHTRGKCVYGVFLEQDGRPLPVEYLGSKLGDEVVLFDLADLLKSIDNALESSPRFTVSFPATDQLSKSAFRNLRESFAKNKRRTEARSIAVRPASVQIGIKNIAATLAMAEQAIAARDLPLESDRKILHWPIRTSQKEGCWTIVNASSTGACLQWKGIGTTGADIGDIIAVNVDESDPDCEWRPALIRWLRIVGTDELRMGVEYIHGLIEQQRFTNPDAKSHFSYRDCLVIFDEDAEDNAAEDMIPPRTLIAPAGSFKKGSVVESKSMARYKISEQTACNDAVETFIVERLVDP